MKALQEKTEQYCVVMQTLLHPPKINTEWAALSRVSLGFAVVNLCSSNFGKLIFNLLDALRRPAGSVFVLVRF